MNIKKITTIFLITVMTMIAALVFPACSCDGGRTQALELLPNVVTISTTGADGEKSGSGVLVCHSDELPVLLTSYHVVSGAKQILVTPHDGNTVSATLLGYSEYHDIAVLSLTTDYGMEFTDLVSGDLFGSAGLDFAYSIGKRSGTDTEVSIYDGECTDTSLVVPAESVTAAKTVKYVPVIEVTCNISAGMSGGAIISGGKLVGIGSYRDETADRYFAVPAMVAKRVLDLSLAGRVNERKEVQLLGEAAAQTGHGVFFFDETGSAGVLAMQQSRRLHTLGFSGTFTAEGFSVNRIGSTCPIPIGAIISEIGGVSTHDYAAVLDAIYACELKEGSASSLTVTYLLDGESHGIQLTDGTYSLAVA